MKSPASTAAFVAAMALALVCAACAQPSTPPRDVGNMAFPAPLPQGNVGTDVGKRAADTGNMAYPPSAGNVGSTARPVRGVDTNDSQYQPPLPQGNLGTTVTK